ncbi:MAG: HAD family hydrolase, partial [Bacteroidota bacterium]
MRYHALATDYDGTLAHDGKVASHILDALKRLKASGRKLILVTGRELDELKSIFPEINLFDRVVAENGALLYRPATLEEKLLGEPPPAAFVESLKRKGVAPMSVGRVIIATWEPHQHAVLESIKELSLERQVIFNKGAVMVLPSGINKAKGLEAALEELCLSLHNVVAVGDAENDNAMLEASECAVAVSNALPRLKENADWVTHADHGDGVVELIERLLENDLSQVKFQQPDKKQLALGTHSDGSAVQICPYGVSMLLAGTSGGGKSTFTTAFLERLVDMKYQFCLVDPEGDYLTLEGVIVLGDTEHPPVIEEVIKLLEKPGQSTAVCTLAIPFQDRPAFFHKLLPAILELRSRTGRPHWLILDEAHHLLPA